MCGAGSGSRVPCCEECRLSLKGRDEQQAHGRRWTSVCHRGDQSPCDYAKTSPQRTPYREDPAWMPGTVCFVDLGQCHQWGVQCCEHVAHRAPFASPSPPISHWSQQVVACHQKPASSCWGNWEFLTSRRYQSAGLFQHQAHWRPAYSHEVPLSHACCPLVPGPRSPGSISPSATALQGHLHCSPSTWVASQNNSTQSAENWELALSLPRA